MTTQTNDAVVTHRIGADGMVVVRIADGQVRLRGVTGDDATVRAADGNALVGLDIEPGERSLTIRTGRGIELRGFGWGDRSRGRRRTRDVEIEIPSGATVIVEGASTDVEVRGLRGDQRYRSASGDLVLREVSGSLTIEALSGDVEIEADGPSTISARSVSGDLDVRAGSIAELRASTTSGDLYVAGSFDGDGPFSIETVTGDATLSPANGVRVEARTITGDIDSELPARRDDADGRRALVIGAGGPTITFRSTSGDLRVVAADRATPHATPGATAPARSTTHAPVDDARLTILRALERGEIDVAEAGRRLEVLGDGDDA
jgi:putative adhesin